MADVNVSRKPVFVSVKAVVLHPKDGRVLTMLRTETAPSRPLYWDLPGGILDYGEKIEIGIEREIKEEVGLDVFELKLWDVVSAINDLGDFWVTICFVCRAKTSEVVLSYEHKDFRWVSPEEFLTMKVSPRNFEFVKKMLG